MKFPTLILLSIFLFGCKEQGSNKRQKIKPEPIVEIANSDLKHFESFCQELAKKLTANDAEFVEKAIDIDRFARKLLVGISLSKNEEAGFIDGFVRSSKKRKGSILASALGEKTQFISIKDFEGQRVCLFRIDMANGGSSYLLLQPIIDHKNEPKFCDLYVLTSMEWSSTSTRRMILPGLKNLLGSRWDKAVKSNKTKDYLKNIQTLHHFNEAARSGLAEKVKEAYKDLPTSIQKERYFWSIYLSYLADDEQNFLKEASEYREAFPDDPGVAFSLIEYDYLLKDWDKVLENIEKVEEYLGTDGLLLTLKANTFQEKGNYSLAYEKATEAIKLEKDMEDAWWSLMVSLNGLKNFPEMVKTLKSFNIQFNTTINKDDLNEEVLSDFIASPEGQAYFNEVE